MTFELVGGPQDGFTFEARDSRWQHRWKSYEHGGGRTDNVRVILTWCQVAWLFALG